MRALIPLVLLAAACGTKVVDLDPPDAGPMANEPPPPQAASACYVETAGETRCVRCKSTVLEERGCLKCEVFEANTSCRLCYWSDQPKTPCKQCLDPAGKLEPDACDDLRDDLPRTSS